MYIIYSSQALIDIANTISRDMDRTQDAVTHKIMSAEFETVCGVLRARHGDEYLSDMVVCPQ